MSKVIEYMEEMGLNNIDAINHYFLTTDLDTILIFNQYIINLIQEDWNTVEYTPFLFFPSGEISGFGGCGEIKCSNARANQFVRFSSLYCDVTYLHIPDIINAKVAIIKPEKFRYALSVAYSVINTYLPLLKTKIAKIIPETLSICKDCFHNSLFDEYDFTLFNNTIETLANKAKMSIITSPLDKNSILVNITNIPELSLEHDVYYNVDDDLLSEIKSVETGSKIISDNSIIKIIIINLIKREYAKLKMEASLASTYSAKVITNKLSDKMIIDDISKDKANNICPEFEMPFLENIDIETILKLRESEYHAFNDYRIAMNKASKEYINNDNNTKEIYDDIIYPAFVNLDRMFQRNKKMRALKAVSQLAIISSTVVLGVTNSIVPSNPVGIATAIGGSAALVKHISDIIERKTNSENELEKNDFYFLWKLKNRG